MLGLYNNNITEKVLKSQPTLTMAVLSYAVTMSNSYLIDTYPEAAESQGALANLTAILNNLVI